MLGKSPLNYFFLESVRHAPQQRSSSDQGTHEFLEAVLYALIAAEGRRGEVRAGRTLFGLSHMVALRVTRMLIGQ